MHRIREQARSHGLNLIRFTTRIHYSNRNDPPLSLIDAPQIHS